MIKSTSTVTMDFHGREYMCLLSKSKKRIAQTAYPKSLQAHLHITQLRRLAICSTQSDKLTILSVHFCTA